MGIIWQRAAYAIRAHAQVDDLEPVELSAYYDPIWGPTAYGYKHIAKDLEPGRHTLRIVLSDDPEHISDELPFSLDAILVAGLGE